MSLNSLNTFLIVFVLAIWQHSCSNKPNSLAKQEKTTTQSELNNGNSQSLVEQKSKPSPDSDLKAKFIVEDDALLYEEFGLIISNDIGLINSKNDEPISNDCWELNMAENGQQPKIPNLSIIIDKQLEEIIQQDVQDSSKAFVGYKLSFNNPKFKANFSKEAFEILNKKIEEKKETYKRENRIIREGNQKVAKNQKDIQWQVHENNPVNIYWCKLGNDTLISINYNQVIEYDEPGALYSDNFNSIEVFSVHNKDYVNFGQMFKSELGENIRKLITKVTKEEARKNYVANYPNLSADQMLENFKLSTIMYEDKWAFTPKGVVFNSFPADEAFGARSSLYILLPYENFEQYLRK